MPRTAKPSTDARSRKDPLAAGKINASEKQKSPGDGEESTKAKDEDGEWEDVEEIVTITYEGNSWP